MDIDKMIDQLLDMDIVRDDNSVEFSEEAKKIIHQIALKCNEIPIIKETQEKAEQYGKNLSAEQVYIEMLYKIVEAPTSIHMIMSARMLIPIIDRKIRGED